MKKKTGKDDEEDRRKSLKIFHGIKTTKYNLFLENYQQFGIWYLHFSLLKT
jgi:hypothetical protein